MSDLLNRQITELILGPYCFTIVDSEQYYEGRIIGRTFKMGGTYPDCVNIAIKYNEQSKPIGASIPYVMTDPDCSKGVPLDRGSGSVMMIKALLRHIHKIIPSITKFFFDDKSNIECGTEEEQRSRRYPKKGSFARPIPLNYFSIAFNGYTWYEKHFNAMYMNEEKHTAYRTRVREFLTEEKEKIPSFIDFFRSIPEKEALSTNKLMLEEVKMLYERANTFQEFFSSIPKMKRCAHARVWLISFLTERLRGIFSNNDWFIDVTQMDESVFALVGGKGKRINKTRKMRPLFSFYIPRGVRREGVDYPDGQMIGVDHLD